jgi:carboxyl-terminal processing protease
VSDYNNSRSQIKLPIFLSLALACGIFIGAIFFDNTGKNDVKTAYKKFADVLSYIDKDYVDTVDLQSLVEFSISSMLEKLDPHTVYIPKTDVQVAHSQLEGDFEGIGIEFNIIKDTIIVVAPISGGPSEKAGLLAGDKIIKVNDSLIAGKTISNADVFTLLRGKKGSEVKLSVKRGGQKKLIDHMVIRDKIPTYSIEISYMVDASTGYIKVSRFAANTYQEFYEALKKLKKAGLQNLILDLRDNPGGYMDRATRMADEFLSGNKLIVYTDGKDNKYDQKIYANKTGLFEDGALIVLINEGSASASEIVAGAVQDNDRALIIGRRSFGKGLVQMPITLKDNSELRLTISRYFTPSGRSIQKPYGSEGLSDYNSDLLKRYQHGEFFHVDSIKLNDSLKYTTINGRTVYGGGGIMPDIFVPRDTSAFTNYLVDIFNKNIIREFTLNYYSSNKDILETMDIESFKKDFEITDKMLDEVVQMATASGVKFKPKEFNKSKEYLKTNIKAYIARSIWGNDGFYPILNSSDEVFVQALNHIDEAKKMIGK